MGEFVKVATIDEIESGQAKMVDVEGKEVALFNLDGTCYAIDNTCTHVGGPLSEGSVEGDQVTCPLHGATFNIKTGEVLGPPASVGVTCYNVRMEGSNIEIEV